MTAVRREVRILFASSQQMSGPTPVPTTWNGNNRYHLLGPERWTADGWLPIDRMDVPEGYELRDAYYERVGNTAVEHGELVEAASGPVSRDDDALIEDSFAQYASYCDYLGFDHPVPFEELEVPLSSSEDPIEGLKVAVSMLGLTARAARLSRDPAVLEKLFERNQS